MDGKYILGGKYRRISSNEASNKKNNRRDVMEMILSVSRRTDIPAFYSQWFMNRIQEGYVLVRNPMNKYQVSKVMLNPQLIDCIVFWTKNPIPMFKYLDILDAYRYYFQFTLTSYDQTIEKGLPSKRQLIKSFQNLSQKIGKERVIWRYDPIILSDKFSIDYHLKYFDLLCSKLYGYTNKCIVSFLEMYTKTKRNMQGIELKILRDEEKIEFLCQLHQIANKYDIVLETCSESLDLSKTKIKQSKCIDDQLIKDIFNIDIQVKKDSNQRKSCQCAASIDIGEYNTCSNQCIYCYANFSSEIVNGNMKKHIPTSPYLIGNGEEKDIITDKKMVSQINYQLRLDVGGMYENNDINRK